MKAKKIYNSDIADILISSLPTRPTALREYGGAGYGATEMKAAFDKLPVREQYAYIMENWPMQPDVADLLLNSSIL